MMNGQQLQNAKKMREAARRARAALARGAGRAPDALGASRASSSRATVGAPPPASKRSRAERARGEAAAAVRGTGLAARPTRDPRLSLARARSNSTRAGRTTSDDEDEGGDRAAREPAREVLQPAERRGDEQAAQAQHRRPALRRSSSCSGSNAKAEQQISRSARVAAAARATETRRVMDLKEQIKRELEASRSRTMAEIDEFTETFEGLSSPHEAMDTSKTRERTRPRTPRDRAVASPSRPRRRARTTRLAQRQEARHGRDARRDDESVRAAGRARANSISCACRSPRADSETARAVPSVYTRARSYWVVQKRRSTSRSTWTSTPRCTSSSRASSARPACARRTTTDHVARARRGRPGSRRAASAARASGGPTAASAARRPAVGGRAQRDRRAPRVSYSLFKQLNELNEEYDGLENGGTRSCARSSGSSRAPRGRLGARATRSSRSCGARRRAPRERARARRALVQVNERIIDTADELLAKMLYALAPSASTARCARRCASRA